MTPIGYDNYERAYSEGIKADASKGPERPERPERKPTAKQLAKQLDRQIETLYYQHAQGRQIPVLNIVKIYVAGREAFAAGQDVEAAIIAAIAAHTEVAR